MIFERIKGLTYVVYKYNNLHMCTFIDTIGELVDPCIPIGLVEG